MDNKDPEMLKIAAKLKEFLESNNVFIYYFPLEEKLVLKHKILVENPNYYGRKLNLDKFEISEEIWMPHDN